MLFKTSWLLRRLARHYRNRGSDPRLLRQTTDRLLDRTDWGATPCIKKSSLSSGRAGQSLCVLCAGRKPARILIGAVIFNGPNLLPIRVLLPALLGF